MIKLSLIRNSIIAPTLLALDLDKTPENRWAAELLLIGTGLVESRFRATKQDEDGPALGYWQIEPDTYRDVWINYLGYRPKMAERVLLLAETPDPPPAEALRSNHKLCCAVARLKYYRSHRQLPNSDDFEAMGRMWVEVYNAGGAATIERWRIEIIPVLAAIKLPPV